MKLKLIASNETKVLHYETGNVVIGSGDTHHADIIIAGLKPVHMRFIEQNGQYFILNEANDPFLSLNGLPFHKKSIKDKDVIEFSPVLSIIVEDLGAAPVPTVETILAQPDRKPKPIRINDIEEEAEPQKPAPSHKGKIGGLESTPFYKSFKTIFTLAGMAAILAVFIIGAFYTRAAERSAEEEVTAAEAISDIAMAFMYAQVNHLKPQKHNWSDPDFIRNNLNAVMTHDFPALSNLDSHGQFQNTPYILRTYTNTDFTHFIVIAQPSPGVTQWVAPRTAIAIDSKLMQLRKIKDLRTLNRLLVNPTILDGPQASSVTALIELGELIPLAKISQRKAKQGFELPKALALFYPGAENRIYNAPRYYQFGESIINRALNSDDTNQHERVRLQQEMQVLSQLPHMVLYSSKGMEYAMEVQRALSNVYPDAKFISGYLKFNSKAHLISSNLILDSDVALNPSAVKEWIPGHQIIENAVEKIQNEARAKEQLPLKIKLQDLLHQRRESLEPTITRLIATIECCIDSPAPNAGLAFDNAVNQFKTNTQREDDKLKEKIKSLAAESHISEEELREALKETNMEYWHRIGNSQ
jgi:hypothetical protein